MLWPIWGGQRPPPSEKDERTDRAVRGGARTSCRGGGAEDAWREAPAPWPGERARQGPRFPARGGGRRGTAARPVGAPMGSERPMQRKRSAARVPRRVTGGGKPGKHTPGSSRASGVAGTKIGTRPRRPRLGGGPRPRWPPPDRSPRGGHAHRPAAVAGSRSRHGHPADSREAATAGVFRWSRPTDPTRPPLVFSRRRSTSRQTDGRLPSAVPARRWTRPIAGGTTRSGGARRGAMMGPTTLPTQAAATEPAIPATSSPGLGREGPQRRRTQLIAAQEETTPEAQTATEHGGHEGPHDQLWHVFGKRSGTAEEDADPARRRGSGVWPRAAEGRTRKRERMRCAPRPWIPPRAGMMARRAGPAEAGARRDDHHRRPR